MRSDSGQDPWACARQLRARRARLGLLPSEVADAAGIAEPVLRAIEMGEAPKTLAVERAIGALDAFLAQHEANRPDAARRPLETPDFVMVDGETGVRRSAPVVHREEPTYLPPPPPPALGRARTIVACLVMAFLVVSGWAAVELYGRLNAPLPEYATLDPRLKLRVEALKPVRATIQVDDGREERQRLAPGSMVRLEATERLRVHLNAAENARVFVWVDDHEDARPPREPLRTHRQRRGPHTFEFTVAPREAP